MNICEHTIQAYYNAQIYNMDIHILYRRSKLESIKNSGINKTSQLYSRGDMNESGFNKSKNSYVDRYDDIPFIELPPLGCCQSIIFDEINADSIEISESIQRCHHNY